MDISLIIHDPNLYFVICIDNIAIEGNVSQICNIGPGSFLITSIPKDNIKSFCHKIKTKN